jgi:hypothetical protein
MNNKYYLPDIDEFRVGFEFEGKDTSCDITGHLWKPSQIHVPEQMFNVTRWVDDEEVRVKYLDKEDIEDLGFLPMIPVNALDDYIPTQWNTDTLNNGWQLQQLSNRNYQINYGMYNTNKVYFEGEIKNKSELIRILNRIGYAKISFNK